MAPEGTRSEQPPCGTTDPPREPQAGPRAWGVTGRHSRPGTLNGGAQGATRRTLQGNRLILPQKGLSPDGRAGLLKTILKQGSQETQKYKKPFRGSVAEVAKKLPSSQQV